MRIARAERYRQRQREELAVTSGWSAVLAYFRATNRKRTEPLSEFLTAALGPRPGEKQASRTATDADRLLESVRRINAALGGEDKTGHG